MKLGATVVHYGVGGEIKGAQHLAMNIKIITIEGGNPTLLSPQVNLLKCILIILGVHYLSSFQVSNRGASRADVTI